MPARHYEQQPGLVRETVEKVISKPGPRFIALELGICLSGTLDRIIDHAEIETEAVDRAVNCRVTKRAVVTNEFDDAAVSRPARGADAQVREDFVESVVATNSAEQMAIRGRAEFIRIRGIDRFQVCEATVRDSMALLRRDRIRPLSRAVPPFPPVGPARACAAECSDRS